MRLPFVRFACLAVLALSFSMSCVTRADVVWDESIDGDLSGNRLAPTSIPLSAGTSTMAGSMTFDDKEYFTVVVPESHELTALIPSEYAGDDGIAFIGLQEGSQFTVPPETAAPGDMLGWTHFGEFSGNIGVDILAQMGSTFGSIGFTPPLPSGSYTFWVQQLDGLLVTYEFEFEVASLSAPPTGDYNGNGTVDAADYVIWRKTEGQNIPVGTGADGSGPEGNPDGIVDSFDFDFWKSQFGEAPGAGSLGEVHAPEPSTAWLALAAAAGSAWRGRRASRWRP